MIVATDMPGPWVGLFLKHFPDGLEPTVDNLMMLQGLGISLAPLVRSLGPVGLEEFRTIRREVRDDAGIPENGRAMRHADEIWYEAAIVALAEVLS